MKKEMNNHLYILVLQLSVGYYPNLGAASGRPWLGWFIGCVGMQYKCLILLFCA